MKKLIAFIVLIAVLTTCNFAYSQISFYKILDANNISSTICNSGVFNQYPARFEWPKGSGTTAIYTAGINLAGKVNGKLRQAMGSYRGEYVPGYCNDTIAVTNSNFKLYKVSRGDNQYNNPDWANWGLMVPYGAPFVDVNNNGIFEPAIDTPGVKNAASTIFVCMTDGFYSTHISNEGFGGGIEPLFAEVHMTAWAYTQPSYSDMQFIKYEIINKGNNPWTSTFFSIVGDPDLGNPTDDYIACDTIRRLGICYNGDNYDEDYYEGIGYGANPPAVGIILLRGIINKTVAPNVNLGLTSFCYFTDNNSSPPPCESDPYGEPNPAYLMMKGYKKDSSRWLNPTSYPFQKTKFCYSGDPETNTGWTEAKGCVQNCGGDSGIILSINPKGDRRFVISSGAENFTFNIGDTQTVYLCQLIARGTSNLNSVTKLKQLADVALNFYNNNFAIGVQQISSVVPDKYELFQNYPNPFNSMTNVKFQMQNTGTAKIIIYDVAGKEVALLVNDKLNPGSYEIKFYGSNLASGIYFYKLIVDNTPYAVKKMVLIK